MTLTKEQLEAIRQRAESATAGPWEFYETLCGEIFPNHNDGRYTDADLEFISKAREDIPALLAEIDRLSRHNYELITELRQRDESAVDTEQAVEEARKLRRELERQRIERDFDWDIGY